MNQFKVFSYFFFPILIVYVSCFENHLLIIFNLIIIKFLNLVGFSSLKFSIPSTLYRASPNRSIGSDTYFRKVPVVDNFKLCTLIALLD